LNEVRSSWGTPLTTARPINNRLVRTLSDTSSNEENNSRPSPRLPPASMGRKLSIAEPTTLTPPTRQQQRGVRSASFSEREEMNTPPPTRRNITSRSGSFSDRENNYVAPPPPVLPRRTCKLPFVFNCITLYNPVFFL
jgi:hypothetical protein